MSTLAKKLKNLKIPTSKNLPDWAVQLNEMSLTDMTLRMHLLRIPFEPLIQGEIDFGKIDRDQSGEYPKNKIISRLFYVKIIGYVNME